MLCFFHHLDSNGIVEPSIRNELDEFKKFRYAYTDADHSTLDFSSVQILHSCNYIFTTCAYLLHLHASLSTGILKMFIYLCIIDCVHISRISLLIVFNWSTRSCLKITSKDYVRRSWLMTISKDLIWKRFLKIMSINCSLASHLRP